MDKEEHERYHRRLLYIFIVLLALLFGGSFFYHKIEGWRYLDAIYFSAATMTTVGYGDLSPQTDIGKIFSIFYLFISVGIALYGLSVIGAHLVEVREEYWMQELLNTKKHTKNFQEGLRRIFLPNKEKVLEGHNGLFDRKERRKK